MPLSNILSGAAFRSALLSMILFSITFSIVGIAVYRLVESSQYKELQQQIAEELILFTQIEKRDGLSALVDAITALETPLQSDHRIVGLFDKDGNHLAGSNRIAPDFIGWKSIRLDAQFQSQSGEYYTHTVSLSSSTLVIGRSTRSIHVLLRDLATSFVLAGMILLVATLGIGYLLSHRVHVKLVRMCDVLNEVSRGDLTARLPVSAQNDQIDKAAVQINAHLEHLALLMTNTRNTIQAVAHDLRTPLHRASLLLEGALREVNPGSSTVEDKLEEAAQELENITEIFDTVLRIARLSKQSDKSSFTTVSVFKVLNDIADLFLPVAESRRLFLVNDADSAITHTVHGDERMLRQLMVNLVENALLHCPEGSTITLSSAQGSDSRTLVQVADNGPGIPHELHEKVLEPFYRLDNSRSGAGNGLGLALVRAIATRHNASLTLEDNDPGLRVTVGFPSTQ